MDSFEVWGIVLPGHRADDAGVCRVVTWRSPYGAADARFTKCGLDLPVGIFGVRALLPLTFAAHVHATARRTAANTSDASLAVTLGMRRGISTASSPAVQMTLRQLPLATGEFREIRKAAHAARPLGDPTNYRNLGAFA